MELSQEQRSRLRELARQAEEVFRQSKQQGNRPLTFAELEEASIEAGDFMTAQMMQAGIERRPPDAEPPCCPTCERVGELQAEQEARVLQTDRGEVSWLESAYYCRHCRRSFFPSVA